MDTIKTRVSSAERRFLPRQKIDNQVESKKFFLDCDLDVEILDLNSLRAIIREDVPVATKTTVDLQGEFGNPAYRLQDNEHILISLESDPYILFEDGASFCTLLITIDSSGNAVMLHEALARIVGVPDSSKKEILEKYNRSIEGLNQNRVTIMTGTNISERSRSKVAQMLQRVLSNSGPLIKLFTKARLFETTGKYGSEEYAKSLLKEARKLLSGQVSYTQDEIPGYIFVPKQLSVDGRNKLYLMLETNANHYSQDQLQELHRILFKNNHL